MSFVSRIALPQRTCWAVAGEMRETLFWPCKSGKARAVMLLVPGNPGLIDFYIDFCTALHSLFSDSLDIIGVSHLGHTRFSDNRGLAVKRSSVPSLADQVANMVAVFDQIDADYRSAAQRPKMLLCGHSVGCYFSEKIVECRSDRVDRVFSLFPAVEDIAGTPRGRQLWPMFYPGVRQLAAGLVDMLVWLLPSAAILGLAGMSRSLSEDSARTVAEKMLHGPCINSILKMAADEMDEIGDLNEELYRCLGHKFVMYYGSNDGWVPTTHHKRMAATNTKGKIYMCQNGYPHSFVTTHSAEMALVVADMLREEMGCWEPVAVDTAPTIVGRPVATTSLGRAGAQGAPVGEKSHILDKNNFDFKTSTGTWIIKHYSPKCLHCLHFQPKWDQVVTQQAISLSAQDVYFGEIDCLESQELCTQNEALAWPTVGMFRAGKRLASLEGDKSEQELSDFIKRTLSETDATPRAYDANSVILAQGNFTETTKHGTWIVKHYSPVCHHCRQMAPEWVKLTDELAKQMAGNQILFGEVDCPANKKVCEENHVDGYPTVNLYVNGRYIEEIPVKYTYDAMKGYVLKLPERVERGDFVQPTSQAPSPGLTDTPVSSNDVTDAKHGTEEYNPYGEVVTLTKESFADKTSSGPWFVKFYAPWCTHCQHLAPIWTQLGEASKGKVNIGKINCDDASALCAKYNVQGYPTLKLLWEGETTDFKGT
ncbi:Thioredoxin domain-containing protein 5, partial [Coemansia sp. S155-1]